MRSAVCWPNSRDTRAPPQRSKPIVLATGASLSEWLAWLETLSPKEIDLGLERVSCVLDRLQLARPENVLLIAGTNGKGSSVAMAEALLLAAGRHVGAYTSPHISRYNERIVVNGVASSDAEIIVAFEKVEAARDGVELTYFEFGTLAATVVFAAAELDVWILEVGLGGRLDATNVFEPTSSLITNVALDHCDWLGHDVETIGAEKAGVMRSGNTTLFGGSPVPESVKRHAREIGATLLTANDDFGVEALGSDSWSWFGQSGKLGPLRAPGLVGDFQVINAAAVLALLDAAGLMDGIDAQCINDVLPKVSLPGRAQRLRAVGRNWLVDVAHNPAAAEELAATLASLASHESLGRTTAIVGLLDDKEVAGVIGPLAAQVDQWIAMPAQSPRALPANELARQISNLSGKACLVVDSARTAIEFARRNTSENDRILVTGSFFTVGPILDHLALVSRPTL